ncbi:DUF4136 domain-containing protein [Flavihumibacter petaseus]|uniref:DUF4136 domain-containing protein n=1 Tax=Flavihumibacter petaseus NBRC 106054 TaxID=1220578 RepID=A0A0E9MU59_9BACT|nr:DUF4136 domain-containing protein [Flavihumibacter petaseus]GAO41104.1 hypothetical protein FPE01S_01_01160 [Flavihumibacter petaseus NBRC 106054]
MRKTSYPLLFCLLIAAAAGTGCTSSVKVTTDYDRAANFSQYKTFAIYKDDAKTDNVSQLNSGRIENAIKAEMIKKGFTENTSSPDLLVNAVTIVKNKQSISSTTNYYGYGGYYRPYAWGGGMGVTGNTTYNVDDYKDGSLIIDVVDAAGKKLIWQGTGNKEIDNKDYKDPDKMISEAVTKIMASFPPGAAAAK